MFSVLGNTLGLEHNIERVNFQYTTFRNDILFCITFWILIYGGGGMAIPLEILAYGSHKKRICAIKYACK